MSSFAGQAFAKWRNEFPKAARSDIENPLSI
jgi:hypothetical protein